MPTCDASYNPERVKRGIPILPSDWKCEYTSRGKQEWDPPTNKFGTPRHGWKIVSSYDGVIYEECDGFLSGETYSYVNADVSETREAGIVVYFDYDAEHNGKDPWRYDYTDKNNDSRDVSRAEANQLLMSWGLPPI